MTARTPQLLTILHFTFRNLVNRAEGKKPMAHGEDFAGDSRWFIDCELPSVWGRVLRDAYGLANLGIWNVFTWFHFGVYQEFYCSEVWVISFEVCNLFYDLYLLILRNNFYKFKNSYIETLNSNAWIPECECWAVIEYFFFQYLVFSVH